jgi:hypothetical protein
MEREKDRERKISTVIWSRLTVDAGMMLSVLNIILKTKRQTNKKIERLTNK